MDTPSQFSAFFYNRNTVCDFLIASLDDMTKVYPYGKEFRLEEHFYFLEEVTSLDMRQELKIQLNFIGPNTFGTMKRFSRQGGGSN